MSFLAPGFFVAALCLAAAVLGFHYIVTRQPPSGPLPTARFVPMARVEVTTLARRPEDLLLLLLRLLLILVIGAAFARPIFTPGHRPVARIVLADISRDVRAIAEVRDSVARIGADRLFLFDSLVRRVDPSLQDWGMTAGDAPGRLSSALIAGFRAAADLRASADSIELVLVSPASLEEWDASTPALRALWPGPIRHMRVRARDDSITRRVAVAVRAATGDPLLVAATIAGLPRGDSAVRLVRDDGTPDDSLWAAAKGTLIRWPTDSAPPGWRAWPVHDTIGAVYAGDVAVVYPFIRRWSPGPASGRPIARWVDGQPAATERRVGNGCIRDVAIPIPARGDLVLRPDLIRLLIALAEPCGARHGAAAATADIAALVGTGGLATSRALGMPALRITPLVPWLLGAGLLLALGELLLRRRAPRAVES
jgi:hypothetical protein